MKTYTITLNEDEINRLKEDLRERAEANDSVAEYIEEGSLGKLGKPEDAASMRKQAELFRKIITSIEKQVSEQTVDDDHLYVVYKEGDDGIRSIKGSGLLYKDAEAWVNNEHVNGMRMMTHAAWWELFGEYPDDI